MVSVQRYPERDPGINDPPGLLQYPGVVRTFARQFLGHHLSEESEHSVLSGRPLGGVEREPSARTKVVLMLPLGYATEAPQDQVVVYIVPGVPDGDILEQTAVRPQNVVHPGPHLLATAKHAPCLAIPGPSAMARKEMLHRVLKLSVAIAVTIVSSRSCLAVSD